MAGVTVPYVGKEHPLASTSGPIGAGANCQRYAYAVLAQFGLLVLAVRSSELWTDSRITHVPGGDARPLDLVLFNEGPSVFGAHVGVHMAADQVLHLCAEVGRPVVWAYADFANRVRHRRLLGSVRVLGDSRTA